MTADSDSTPTKTCTKCGECKDTSNFHAKPAGKFGFHSVCKSCRAAQVKAWGDRNPERRKEIQRESKRRVRQTAEGRAHLSKLNSEYARRNNVKVNQRLRERKQRDPLLALKTRYRGIIAKAIHRQGFTKRSVAQGLLGCTWCEFRIHIERQFTSGMNWEVFLTGAIHVDHIVAISTAQTEAEIISLSHHTNLRPLWAKDNLSKGAQITHLI